MSLKAFAWHRNPKIPVDIGKADDYLYEALFMLTYSSLGEESKGPFLLELYQNINVHFNTTESFYAQSNFLCVVKVEAPKQEGSITDRSVFTQPINVDKELLGCETAREEQSTSRAGVQD